MLSVSAISQKLVLRYGGLSGWTQLLYLLLPEQGNKKYLFFRMGIEPTFVVFTDKNLSYMYD